MRSKRVWFSAALFTLVHLPAAEAQDVDVAGNLTMRGSTATQGNILKGGVLFLHNFGLGNTFLGSGAGNQTMSGGLNTASGSSALSRNDTGSNNTAIGFGTLLSNTTGFQNSAAGSAALVNNTTGSNNTAIGDAALYGNSTGDGNIAIGVAALGDNLTGSYNTAIGFRADVPFGSYNFTNATAIGAEAIVDASNKIRLGNDQVTVIEGQVGFTASSDRNRKENLQLVKGEEVLSKIRELSLTSWNFIGHDPKQFRHYGPMAQDFFAAFGHDGIGTIGTDTTITSTDIDGILMIAAQALEKRTVEQEKRSVEQMKRIDALTAEKADLKARLEALERRLSHSMSGASSAKCAACSSP